MESIRKLLLVSCVSGILASFSYSQEQERPIGGGIVQESYESESDDSEPVITVDESEENTLLNIQFPKSRGVPVGTVVPFMGTDLSKLDRGWLLADGRSLRRRSYAKLFKFIGTHYGDGGPSGDFNLPNLQGVFVRGVDERGVLSNDPGPRKSTNAGSQSFSSVGSSQGDATSLPDSSFSINGGAHNHSLPGALVNPNDNWGLFDRGPRGPGATRISNRSTNNGGAHGHQITGGDSETRPINIAVYWIIRVK